MKDVRDFLGSNEKLADKVVVFKPEDNVRYVLYMLAVDGEQTEDDVILEITNNTEPCVLIDGNKLELNVLSGLGRLTVLDLESGEREVTDLTEGTQTQVSSQNTIYWYENTGDQPLFIHDHCDGFDTANEPTLRNVVDAFIALAQHS
jgi:hypothetical protein